MKPFAALRNQVRRIPQGGGALGEIPIKPFAALKLTLDVVGHNPDIAM
jgi:hypothetical protein